MATVIVRKYFKPWLFNNNKCATIYPVYMFCVDMFCIDMFRLDMFCIDIFCVDMFRVVVFCVDKCGSWVNYVDDVV